MRQFEIPPFLGKFSQFIATDRHTQHTNTNGLFDFKLKFMLIFQFRLKEPLCIASIVLNTFDNFLNFDLFERKFIYFKMVDLK